MYSILSVARSIREVCSEASESLRTAAAIWLTWAATLALTYLVTRESALLWEAAVLGVSAIAGTFWFYANQPIDTHGTGRRPRPRWWVIFDASAMLGSTQALILSTVAGVPADHITAISFTLLALWLLVFAASERLETL